MAVVRSTAYCSVYLRRSRRMNWATEKGCCHPIHVVVRQFRNVAVADWFAPGAMCIERVEGPNQRATVKLGPWEGFPVVQAPPGSK